MLASLNAQYDEIISWSELYDTASIEAKKMIVSSLIRRVDVYRGYKLHIEFTIDFEQFCRGLDFEAVADDFEQFCRGLDFEAVAEQTKRPALQ